MYGIETIKSSIFKFVVPCRSVVGSIRDVLRYQKNYLKLIFMKLFFSRCGRIIAGFPEYRLKESNKLSLETYFIVVADYSNNTSRKNG